MAEALGVGFIQIKKSADIVFGNELKFFFRFLVSKCSADVSNTSLYPPHQAMIWRAVIAPTEGIFVTAIWYNKSSDILGYYLELAKLRKTSNNQFLSLFHKNI
jgi:hypothetical protein